ncbi:MAG: VanW family protein [Fimbriimonadaceae bacterium]
MSSRLHTRRQAIIFNTKRVLLQLKRLGRDYSLGLRKWPQSTQTFDTEIESRTPLWTDSEIPERHLQLGKVQNLRVALRQLDGVVVPAGEVFSFWKQLGRANRFRGYVVGRELREGCLIPARGGGICQLSNALYDLALKSECEILERHSHTRVIPGSAAEIGRDATVAWNYIDLRFRPSTDLRIETKLTQDELIVTFVFDRPLAPSASSRRLSTLKVVADNIGSCITCGESECFRHAPEITWKEGRPATFVVDAVTPEWVEFVRTLGGRVIAPINGSTCRIARYAWPRCDDSAPIASIRRMLDARLAVGQPPAIVRSRQLRADRKVAIAMANKLTAEDDALIVAQSLLPELWIGGHLGGRKFSVLMSRLPALELQRRLDSAFAKFPDQKSLGDFRADEDWVRAEQEALEAAETIITPHAGIASIFGERGHLLEWRKATVPEGARKPERLIVFPGPTVARKGAYAVRDAARRLGLKVVVLGQNLDSPDFWAGVDLSESTNWLDRAVALVQPSISEDCPVALLKARAAGIPIIACDQCGLQRGEYTEVKFGDDLTEILSNLLTEELPL